MRSPNKGTPKFSEIGSNKGIFPLFKQFPYLKNFPEILEEKTKLCLESSLSARSCNKYLENLLFIVLKNQFRAKIPRKVCFAG